MAGTLIIDKIQTDNSFLTLNVGQTQIATMNVGGIYSSSGTKMIGSDGTIGVATIANTAIIGLVTASQIANVANTQITGNIISSQITSNPTLYGNVSVTGVIGVGGATTSTSGSGITFPATQSASSDANTLDDYEEGDWTPTIIGSTTNPTITYSLQAGKYTKIGRVCYIMCHVSMSSYSGGTGRVLVTGLPFTAGASGIGNGAMANTLVSYMDMAAGYSQITNYVGPSSTNFNWLQTGDNVSYRDMSVAEFQAATTFIVSGFYIVA